ncbi:MAG: RsmB/NOP family class I SAM-dependent RNA methyltransferase [Anaerolineae bacterium]
MPRPPLPPAFLQRMRRWLGEEFPAFVESLEGQPLAGLRLNPAKASAEELARWGFLLDPLPWCPQEGFFLRAPADAGQHPFHAAGCYYLQEPDATAVVPLLEPQPGDLVLDLCAAPGGKATHIASRLRGQGVLVANDLVLARARTLAASLLRWGVHNAAVTAEHPERLVRHFGAAFDRVLVDAPCSGEGMFRKSPEARLAWSPAHVDGCAARQRAILEAAALLVRPGGRLVYSTCTFAPEENEGVVGAFLRKHPEFRLLSPPPVPGFSPGRPDWLEEPALREMEALRQCVRLWPHRTAAEGHFIAILEREEGGGAPAVPPWPAAPPRGPAREAWETFCHKALVRPPPGQVHQGGRSLYLLPEGFPDLRGLRVVQAGLRLGDLAQSAFRPAHALALALDPQEAREVLDLAPDDPRLGTYLQGGSFPAPGSSGWLLVCVAGHPVGWALRKKGRVRSLLPQGWRLPVHARMEGKGHGIVG